MIRHQYQPAETKGLAASVRADSVWTRYDGPRTDSADVSLFWLDPFWAPRQIRDPHGNVTTLYRNDPRFAALVTRIEHPVHPGGQRVDSATYDAHGNIATQVQIDPYGDGRHPKTRYAWDSRWDRVTKVVPPEGDSTMFAYDAQGNRVSEADGNGIYVNYGYFPDGLLHYVLERGETDPRWFEHDLVLRNLARSLTPTKLYETTFVRDALGRDTLVLSPVDTLKQFRERTRTEYDVMDRPLVQQRIGPAINGAPQQTVTVNNLYDKEGNLLSLTRSMSPNPNNIQPLVTSWTYDGAGRPRVQTHPDGKRDSTFYDRAGNVTRQRTRRGHSITMTYDALNRLLKRRLPAVAYDSLNQGIPVSNGLVSFQPGVEGGKAYPLYPNNPNGGYTIAADSALFIYDAMGNTRTANNRDAQVSRTFFRNGQLRAETQRVRTLAELSNGGNFTSHTYTLGYTYDSNGRTRELTHPAQLSPLPAQFPAADAMTRFAYNRINGQPDTITDVLGNRFRYGYGLRRQLDALILPASYTEGFGYDSDGKLIRHRVDRGATQVRDTRIRYDARNRIVHTANLFGALDTLTVRHSGLGYVVADTFVAYGQNQSGARGRHSVQDSFAMDGLGKWTRLKSVTEDRLASSGQQYFKLTHIRSQFYDPVSGRLARATNPVQRDTFVYDAAGNTAFTYQVWQNTTSDVNLEDRASYYDAANTLRAADYRRVEDPTTIGAGFEGAFEEYRYDALGRRVWVRARRHCDRPQAPGECQLDWVRRTVWNGAQELYEIQMPDDATHRENDTQPVQLALHSTGFDPNPFYGRVAYTYGMGIDQPLSVVRANYVDLKAGASHITFSPFAIVPLWNARGESDDGYFADTGLRTRCAPGDSSRCVRIGWISQWRLLGHADLDPLFWHGTLLQDKRTETRTFYRRNRYYDPATGQFTQEDPIGLAGGLNLYGFAGGDPVNFSDPFGLCPPQITGRPCSGWVATGVGFVPLFGDAIDVAGALKGRDLLTGERIGNVGAGVAIIGTIFGSGRLAREGGHALIKGAERIQRFANKHGVEVSVVGSRASGTAGAASDYDYVITGGNAKVRAAARRGLPRGQTGGELDANGRGTGIDVFNGNVEPLDRSRPHLTFRPNP